MIASPNATIVSAPGHDTAEAKLRSALALALKCSPVSRQQIADSMNRLLGRPPERPITINVVNSWVSETKERVRFPAAWIPAFCAAVMDDSVQLALLSPEHRARLEIKKDLETLRRAITTLLAAERKRDRAKAVNRPKRKNECHGHT